MDLLQTRWLLELGKISTEFGKDIEKEWFDEAHICSKWVRKLNREHVQGVKLEDLAMQEWLRERFKVDDAND